MSLLFQTVQIFVVLLYFFGLTACHYGLVRPELKLEGKVDELNYELANLPKIKPIRKNVFFQVKPDQREARLKGHTSEAGSRFELTYPAGKMLQSAGDAAAQRWFVEDATNAQKKVEIVAQVEDLYYNDVPDTGKDLAVIAVKIHIQVLVDKHILLENTYDSGKQYSERFNIGMIVGAGESYEKYFSRTIYKAMLVSLDKAMQAITEQSKGQAL